MLTKEMSQTIQLADENCLPDEAWEMLNDLIDERTRNHNVRMLRKWERNHSFDSKPFDLKIKELKARCKELKTMMEEAKRQGFNIEIKANIELRVVRKPFKNVVKLNINHN